MPKFSYTVLNNDNKQLTGTINAQNEGVARHELNALGFSVISINQASKKDDNVLQALNKETKNISKYEFSGIDKNNKKVTGTIQGQDIYLVYKRLIEEYQFNISAIYSFNLSTDEKEKAHQQGIDKLADRYQEEQFSKENLLRQKESSEQELKEKQAALKQQIDFVLQKINTILDTYQNELNPQTKAKIKYYIEKILRIRNSTNLNYVRHTAEEMLDYIQKAELFLHEELRSKEKTELVVEAKSMMMDLHNVNTKGQKDLARSMREWRQANIVTNPSPTPLDITINWFFSLFIGTQPDSSEIIEARNSLIQTKQQLWQFLKIYLQSPNKQFKQETLTNLKRLWNLKKEKKQILHDLIQKQKNKLLETTSTTNIDKFLGEILKLAGWVFFFYMIYYYLAIYSSTKQINLPFTPKLENIFQSSIIKYFFTILFIFIALLGIKIEFTPRKKNFDLILIFLFLILSLLIVLNF